MAGKPALWLSAVAKRQAGSFPVEKNPPVFCYFTFYKFQ